MNRPTANSRIGEKIRSPWVTLTILNNDQNPALNDDQRFQLGFRDGCLNQVPS